MDPFEASGEPVDTASHGSQSFVVHLWLEDSAPVGTASAWRGHVTHVQSREQCSVDSLTGIARIIAARLVAAGFLLRWYERLWLLLMRVKR